MAPKFAARVGLGVVVLVSLLAGGGGVSAAAPAAKVPGWRVAASGRTPHREPLMTSVDAPAGNNAWALGFSLLRSNPELDNSVVLIEHWDGRRWQTLSLPPAVAKRFRVYEPFELAIRAAGRSGAWIFGSSWLRWDGHHWHAGRLPGSGRDQIVEANSAAVFGPADVWAFGGAFGLTDTFGYAAHFNGHKWSQVAVPGTREITGVSALSPTDFWAVTGQPRINLFGIPQAPPNGGSVLHWTGRKWTALKLPATLAKHAYLTSVVARSDRDVWVGGAIGLRSAKGTFVPRPVVAHWDGRTWTVTVLPGGSARGNLTFSLAQDGGGGIWATGNCPDCRKFAPQLMWHWRHGRWTGPSKDLLKAKMHAFFVTMAQVGQTSSVWAVGSVFGKPQWAIGLYGKLPH